MHQINHLNLEQKIGLKYDESRGGYATGSDIKFKTTMLRSSLCDYANAHILVKGTITITGEGNNAVERKADGKKGVIFKN